MIKCINIKNSIIVFIFLMIKSINITKIIICVIIFFIFIMIKSINIKNNITCVIIIFIFIIIKSLGASTPNPKLSLDASTRNSKVGADNLGHPAMPTSKLGKRVHAQPQVGARRVLAPTPS
jgi:hypothetical protein